MITKLKIAIDKSGYKQNFIARNLGMDYGNFSKHVTGDRPITKIMAAKIAKILKTDVKSIVEGD